VEAGRAARSAATDAGRLCRIVDLKTRHPLTQCKFHPKRSLRPLVVLRRAGPSDSQSLFQTACDPEVMRFVDWPSPKDPATVEANLQNALTDWKNHSEYQWVILERLTGECAGTISCRPKDHAADFGYFLSRRYWGKGLATEAAKAVVSWLASQPEIWRIWASVDTENARSRRLLARVGLTFEGVMHMATLRPNIGGPPRDTAIYALTKSGVGLSDRRTGIIFGTRVTVDG
jgi:ribosomal-protein-alanine N-acetyltransferase